MAAGAPVEVLAVAGALALGALVRFHLPFTPVPVTLQTLPVLLAGFAVGPRRAMMGVLLFAGLTLTGAPVGATAFGPTFGYLLGFAIAPWIAVLPGRKPLGILLATLAIYVCGAAWLGLWGGLTAGQAVAAGVLPFLPGDAVKALAAWGVVARTR